MIGFESQSQMDELMERGQIPPLLDGVRVVILDKTGIIKPVASAGLNFGLEAISTDYTFTTSSHTTMPSGATLNLILRYGVNAKNELNTFAGTYTKDMIVDPPITVSLSLLSLKLALLRHGVCDCEVCTVFSGQHL